MCGICAIISDQNIAPKLLSSLFRLEYRGYDSCGIFILDDSRRGILRKNVGEVAAVRESEKLSELAGSIGIAHTRWATHGGVTQANAHPHYSDDNNFVLVHNGIIDNADALKQEILSHNLKYNSQTDSEVFVNLVQALYTETQGSVEAVFAQALLRVKGTYAFALFSQHEPDKIFVASRKMPLIIGKKAGCNFVSSDASVFLQETSEVLYLDEHEYGVIGVSDIQIRRIADQRSVDKPVERIQLEQGIGTHKEKTEFPHFMLREIFQQPELLRLIHTIPSQETEPVVDAFLTSTQSHLVGVGTTFYVGLAGSYLFSQIAQLYVPSVSADEFLNLVISGADKHALFISQSGETYDTKEAHGLIAESGSKTSAIVNTAGSSLSRTVQHCILQRSGPEVSVVSTKATLAQLVIVYRLATMTAIRRGVLPEEQLPICDAAIQGLAQAVENILNTHSGLIRRFARENSAVRSWLFMGKGIYYPLAMEVALKMKEVAYRHAEGLPAGFLKHGTLALIDQKILSFFFIPLPSEGRIYEETLIAIQEVKTRGGRVVGFRLNSDTRLEALLDHSFVLPELNRNTYPLLQLVVGQLLSYYTALDLKLNIDKPRNLAKSVTVG